MTIYNTRVMVQNSSHLYSEFYITTERCREEG